MVIAIVAATVAVMVMAAFNRIEIKAIEAWILLLELLGQFCEPDMVWADDRNYHAQDLAARSGEDASCVLTDGCFSRVF